MTTGMRDLRADWRRWNRTERVVSVIGLTAVVIGPLPFLLG
jgi:hypothetical protein